MKKIIVFFGCLSIISGAYAAGRNDSARTTNASRVTIGGMHLNDYKSSLKSVADNLPAPDEVVPAATVDKREAERVACTSNNGWGMGNTFVWASKYSDTNNYSTMVEDIENPENNVCWVLVGLRSIDGRIDLSDVAGKYFEMGKNIKCGEWLNSESIEQKILDGKKTARTLATVGGVVGGAGIGVGAMELFGNQALSGINGLEGLQGQKALSNDDLFVSQLLELKTSDNARYKAVVNMLKQMQDVCATPSQSDCNKVKYNYILTQLGE